MIDSAQLVAQAKQLHEAGQLAEADALYRQALASGGANVEVLYYLAATSYALGRNAEAVARLEQAVNLAPAHPQLRHHLGIALARDGRLAEAIVSLQEAVRLNPHAPEITAHLCAAEAAQHTSLAVALGEQGRWDDAAAHYRQAIELEPDSVASLGNLGNALKHQGKLDEAASCYRRVLEVSPQSALAHNDLGLIAQAQGRLDEAVTHYRRAISLDSHFAEAYSNLGTALAAQSKLDEAEGCCRQAIALKPEYVEAHCDLGDVLGKQDRLEEAISSYRTALRINPDKAEAAFRLASALEQNGDEAGAAQIYQERLRRNPDDVETLNQYGLLVQRQGRLDEALACFDQVLRLNPNLAMAHFYRANTYKLKRMHSAAIAGYRETLRLDPTCSPAYHNLSICHNEMQQPDPAIECCKKGLAIDPNSAPLHDGMAIALHMQGQGDEAIGWYRKAVALDPANARLHSNLIYALNFVPGIAPESIFEEHLAWARRHAEPLTALAKPHLADRTPERRVRVGYVSAHFCLHAVNYFTEPMILAHDRSAFDVFCYSDVSGPDDITARVKAGVDHWRDVAYASDDELARMVRDDRIDILVDLAGHIAGSRLTMFARKPAPIQVTYIGYQNTTGMSAIDYRLTDERADPPGLTDRYHTERLVRLPRSFFCYRPPDDAPEVTSLPALEKGSVTFGSFNSFNKVTPQVLDTWMRILKRVDGSRLLVLAFRGEHLGKRLRDVAVEHGVDPARVVHCERRPIGQYLQLIGQADIALDPFPFTGHTTTCDSVWMGVPVVMLEGDTYASRFGGSVLANVGLDNLVVRSVQKYIEKAVGLAGDLDQLAHLRAELRPRMAASPLLDFVGFTRSVEHAYRQMWREYCGSRA